MLEHPPLKNNERTTPSACTVKTYSVTLYVRISDVILETVSETKDTGTPTYNCNIY